MYSTLICCALSVGDPISPWSPASHTNKVKGQKKTPETTVKPCAIIFQKIKTRIIKVQQVLPPPKIITEVEYVVNLSKARSHADRPLPQLFLLLRTLLSNRNPTPSKAKTTWQLLTARHARYDMIPHLLARHTASRLRTYIPPPRGACQGKKNVSFGIL